MKFLVDTHTHSISSGHAYSTVQEIAREASLKGMEAFVLTDHGPSMLGAPCVWHFGNLKALPDEIYGVRVYRGAEVNITDYEGNVDLPGTFLRKLEFVIASLHDICIEPSTIEEHTEGLINVLKNPYIDAVAHPGNPKFQVDVEKVVDAALKYGKLIEMNNHSFSARSGSWDNCLAFALECAKKRVPVICGSDSHISFSVGTFDKVAVLLEQAKVPEELVVSSSKERFEKYLGERAVRIGSKA